MRRTILVTLAVLVAAGVLFFRPGSPPRDDTGDGVSAPSMAVAERAGLPASSAPPRTANDVPAKPRSLRGTRSDGGLVTDADGHFVPTLDARRLFEYFLTATGEVPADALRARLQHEIARRLAPDAAREATALLDRYLVYRERVRALATAEVPDDGDLDARLATLIALRREVLGAEAAEAFFADEEADAHRLLASRRIANDPSLTPEERAARIEDVFRTAEQDLPDDARAARAAARLATTLRDAEAEIRGRGGDDTDVAAARERLAGPAAAARLAALDQQRNAWRARVDAFHVARERLTRDPALTPDARTRAVARLLEESFTPPERRRVEALDRLAADSPTVR